MKIVFKTKKLERECRNFKEAQKHYGPEGAKILHRRIDQLEAVSDLETALRIKVGKCHALTGNRQGQYAVSLLQPFRLVFIPLENGTTLIEIIEIIDYH